tara:strand:+ start:27101 stop:28729 length:1629 start_codon:yes stop_codon:yes gene_type:complete
MADNAYVLKVNQSDQVIVTGSVGDSTQITFNNTSLITDLALGNGIIYKQDSSNNLMWFKQIGGDKGRVSITNMQFDRLGNIYLAGAYYDSVDFDPSSSVNLLVSNGHHSDAFIAKYSPGGSLIWVKGFGGPNWDFITSILIEDTANVYVSGVFWGKADFNPSLDTNYVTSYGNHDGFISKLSSVGDFKFVYRIGGSGWDRINKIMFNNNHDIVAVGSFEGIANMNPLTTSSNRLYSGGASDVFILRLDTGGNYISTKKIGGVGTVGVTKALIDNDTLYLIGSLGDPSAGTQNGDVDFNPNSAVMNYSSDGTEDSYLAKYDPSDNLIWLNQVGGRWMQRTLDFYISNNSKLFFSNVIKDTSILYNNGVVIDTIIPQNSSSLVAEIDCFGNYQRLTILNSSLSVGVTSLDTDSRMNVYSAGIFQGQTDFNPTTANNFRTPVGQGDIFVMKNFGHLTTSSINYEVKNKSKFKLYPNPNQGEFIVELNNSDSRAIIKVRDISGRIISNIFVQNTNKVELNIEEASGLYFVEVNIDGVQQHFKVIKQ